MFSSPAKSQVVGINGTENRVKVMRISQMIRNFMGSSGSGSISGHAYPAN
jgi:hypothetical protein